MAVPRHLHSRVTGCEFHRKVSSFIQGGERMRYCQDCGRIELLDMFDDDKRRAASAAACSRAVLVAARHCSSFMVHADE